MRAGATRMKVKVDGCRWFDGRASCLLVANMGRLTGGLVAFPDARPDDGRLEIGVVRAETTVQWARVLARLVTGSAHRSRLVRTTTGRRITVHLEDKLPFELDGGDRPKTAKLNVEVAPRAVTVCVPGPRR